MKHVYSVIIAAALTASAGVTVSAETYTPPCTVAIDSEEKFSQWTPFDANDDGGDNQWKYSADKEGALYVENKSKAADDWLISPAITLTAGNTYSVTVFIQNISTYSSDKQKFELCFGQEATIASLKPNQMMKEESLAKSTWPVEKKGTMTATTSGDYYFGIHLYSNSYNGNCLVTKIVVEQQLTYPGAVTDLAVTPATQGKLEATVNWTWPSVNNAGGPLSEISGAKIYRGNSYISATDTYLVATYEQASTPGSAGQWTDNTLTEPGKYYYMVVPFNTNGPSTVSPKKVESDWIGLDTPGSVSNVTATPVAGNDKAVSLNFSYPTGSNGGYLDLSLVKYKITRTSGSDTTVTVEEGWNGTLPYVDTTIPGLDTYYYQVYTVYNNSTSWSGVKSNTVSTGGTLSLPYTNDFANDNSIALWTMLNEGTGTRDWKISSGKLDYWGSGTDIDVYAVTPPFSMKPGAAYQVSFKTYVSRSTDPKPLQVLIGKEPTAAALTTEVFSETINSGIAASKECVFSVDADSKWYVAFRVNGPITGSNDIYVDDLEIKEIVAAPLAPADFKAEAEPLGALGANLSWVNPTKTNAGTTLATLTKMEVRRGDELIATLEDLTAGEATTYQDKALTAPGTYTYTLTPWLNAVEGDKATATSAWIGPDTPKAPASVTVTVAENGDRSIAFEPVTESVNGGYVNYEALTYTVSRNGNALATDLKASPYVDAEADLELAAYTYGVTACAGDLKSDETFAAPVVLGEALDLPYETDFSNADFTVLWTFTNPENPTKNWKYDSSKEAIVADFTNAGAWAITPPFRAVRGECEVSYKATCYSYRYPEDLEVYLITDPDDLSTAKKIADYHVESVDYPNVMKTSFQITDKAGIYRIGYKVVTENQFSCYLKQSDIVQTKVIETTGPLAPADFEAEAKPLGELGATLSWVNPSDTQNGVIIDTVTKMEVRRGDELIATLENLPAGEETTYEDTTITEPGCYSYTIIPYNEDKAGTSASATTSWVGPDTPKAPTSVTVTVAENGDRSIAFEPVSESVNGGYVDFAAITYTVSRNGKAIASDVKTSPYADTDADLTPAAYTYGVTAGAGDLASTETFAAPVVLGVPVDLPYKPDFSNADFSTIWTFVNPENPTENWAYDSTKEALTSESASAGAWAITPSFTALQGICEVSYKAVCTDAIYPEDLEVYLITNPEDISTATKLADYHIKAVESPEVVKTPFKLTEDTGIYRIGYKLVTKEHRGCYLLQSDIEQTVITAGVGLTQSGNGTLRYDAASGRLLLPDEGDLFVYSASGTLVYSKHTADQSVSVTGLPAAAYVAIHQAADGSRKSLKFVK
ncbi:MAG: hypothetical protein PUA94_03980 [Bacteroidales bacterium]|nr:hypothetical protein [Bacteroidales bacterium]